MTTPSIVITGAGQVSALGVGYEAWVEALTPPAAILRDAGTRIEGFDVDEFLDSTKNYLDRGSEFALGATAMALESAGLEADALNGEQTALLLGSALGALDTMTLFYKDLALKGPRYAKPFLFPHTYANTAISLISLEFGLTGTHLNFASGHVAAAEAIVAACDLLQAGRVSAAIAGGYEALCPARSELLKDEPDPGEGAAMFVLESLETAVAREAIVLGQVIGTGMASGTDAETAVQRASRHALEAAGVDRGDTALDPAPQIGNTLGASGAFQLLAALSTMETGTGTAGANVLIETLDPGGAAVSMLVRIGDGTS